MTKTDDIPLSRLAATSLQPGRQVYSTFLDGLPYMLVPGLLASRRPIVRHSASPSTAHVSFGRRSAIWRESVLVQSGSSSGLGLLLG